MRVRHEAGGLPRRRTAPRSRSLGGIGRQAGEHENCRASSPHGCGASGRLDAQASRCRFSSSYGCPLWGTFPAMRRRRTTAPGTCCTSASCAAFPIRAPRLQSARTAERRVGNWHPHHGARGGSPRSVPLPVLLVKRPCAGWSHPQTVERAIHRTARGRIGTILGPRSSYSAEAFTAPS